MSWYESFWLRITGRGDLADLLSDLEREDNARRMRIRRLAAQLWKEAGGHIPVNGGGLIHSFMVTEPDSRAYFEGLAAAQLESQTE